MADPLMLPSFDELAAMAKHNPEQLSRLRQNLCQELIESCSTEMQPRLQAQQSHIERVLKRANNPIHANVLLRQELHRQFMKFSQALNGELGDGQPKATILPFNKKEDWR
ncbi:DUF3135 domain-containing protein [Vibrio cionasavignyae]|uniref:DUF3135 domain-containing protein n=1 Tax=Vibrio cionasavignyae TaxID=2910252 RepID=UPI003D10BE1F